MLAILKRVSLPLLGLLLVAVFIWYAGPYFAFAEYHPLESAVARLIAIAIVVVVLALYVLLKRLRAYRASDKFLRPRSSPGRKSNRRGRPPRPYKLRERFEKAVATLKQQRRERPQPVRLAVVHDYRRSGFRQDHRPPRLRLEVPPGAACWKGGRCEASEARAIVTGGSPTKRCFSIPPVAIRPRTPIAASDSDGVGRIPGAAAQVPRAPPINGVILTINAEDLIKQGDSAREEHVEAARRRLNELNRELRIQLPVYLMVTKCDLVAGFTEYFDDLAHEGRAQVWGVTFPYEQTARQRGRTQVFPAEFDALIARLNERVFARIEEVRDPRRRPRVFAFPQQMAALRDVLAQFVSDVFASTQFDQQILLRGVYFTSGTQERHAGRPAAGRYWPPVWRRAERDRPIVRTRQGVLHRTAAQGSADWRVGPRRGKPSSVETRKAAAQVGAYAAMALVGASSALMLLSVSYGRNRAYHRTDRERTSPRCSNVPPVPAVGLARSAVAAPRCRTVPSSAAADRLSQRHSVDRMRGDSIRASRLAIRRATRTCASSTACCCRGSPRGSSGASRKRRNPRGCYAYLKAYLMLGEPQQLDKKHLQSLVDLEWKGSGAGARVRNGCFDAFPTPSRD